MRTPLLSLAAIMMIAGAPTFAQDAMSSDAMASAPMKKMSAAETKKMKACQAMSHVKMMKNAGCVKLMKMHPDMMKGDDMMKKGQ